MAEVLASLKKIGGSGEQYTETVLWTNPSPTADFANQTVTLSENINNYDYIKFTWKRAKADSLEGNLLVPSDVLNRCRDGQNDLAFHIGASNTTPQTFGRIIQKVSDTSVVFGSCFRTTTNTRANDMCIPLGIIGCNFR